MLKRQKVVSYGVLSVLMAMAGCADQSAQNPVIEIGCVAPLTGDQAQLGIETCNGVRMAVDEANEKGRGLPGQKFKVLALDDQHNPAQAVNAAKKLVANPNSMAVVGHFNSSCTKPASAVYHEARMVQITPSSTNPELSKQGYDTFFRISATDDVQGPAGAQFAFSKLGIQSVFIIDDKTTYGKGIADEFEKKARELGMTLLGHEGITQGDKDFSPLLTKIKPMNPGMIYFGGIYPEGALLIRQARSLDIPAVLMGGDGLATAVFVELASAENAEGTYATMVGGDMKQVPDAQDFVRRYEAKYGYLGQWSAYGYDAANILIATIEQAGVKNREKILETIRKIPKFPGITGEVVFDANGDTQNQFIGIFKFEKGKLVYIGSAA